MEKKEINKYIAKLFERVGAKGTTRREKGIEIWKEWKIENLRKHYNIGEQIMQDYGVTQADIDNIRRESWNRYERLRRKRIKLKKQIEAEKGLEKQKKEEKNDGDIE